MNKLILSGRLTQDPEQRKTQSGAEMATFNLAVNRKRGDTTDFFHCFCMGQNAKYLLQYGTKGMSLELTGECQLGSYTKNGVKQQTVNVFATEIDFTSKNPNLQNNQQQSGRAQHPQQAAPAPQGNGNYQQRPQQQGNGFAPQNGNYPQPPQYRRNPQQQFMQVPADEECPFN